MKNRASAYKDYGSAAVTSLILEALPKVSKRMLCGLIVIYSHAVEIMMAS